MYHESLVNRKVLTFKQHISVDCVNQIAMWMILMARLNASLKCVIKLLVVNVQFSDVDE